MSKPITDDQMRSLWRRRCQARHELGAMGHNGKVIRDFDADERAAHDRLEREIEEATALLTQGLVERDGLFWIDSDLPLVLDAHGDLVPLLALGWERRKEHADRSMVKHAKRLLADASRRAVRIKAREAVAC